MNETTGLENAVRRASSFAAQLHAMPEASFQEIAATRCIRTFCQACGTRLVELAMETGAAAYLDCGRADTVALRADIDAVPTESGPRHLCGHDYHTAALLGAMQMLCGMRDTLPHNVVFLFQPGEECTRGAQAMLSGGLLEKLPQIPARIFGIHNRPEIACGKIAVHSGALMAEKTNFSVRFTGRSGHGGSPHLCVDPLLPAAQFTLGAQSVVSRNVDPLEAAVCAVCSLHCGTEENFAPDQAVLTGSIRTLSHAVHQRVMERVGQLAMQTAAAFECGCELKWLPQVPAVTNGPQMYEIALRAAQKTVGAENITDTAPCLGSEDFAIFGQKIPSFFYWVGSGEPGKENAAWHDPAFRVAEGYLRVAVPLLVHSAAEP